MLHPAGDDGSGARAGIYECREALGHRRGRAGEREAAGGSAPGRASCRVRSHSCRVLGLHCAVGHRSPDARPLAQEPYQGLAE